MIASYYCDYKMESTNQRTENECNICMETRSRFIVMCNVQNHLVCEQCFGNIENIQVCPVCRQANPVYQRIFQERIQNYNSSDSSSSFVEQFDNNQYMQLSFSEDYIRIQVFRPVTNQIFEEITHTLRSLIPQRRSERIAQRNAINYADFGQLGRNYRRT